MLKWFERKVIGRKERGGARGGENDKAKRREVTKISENQTRLLKVGQKLHGFGEQFLQTSLKRSIVQDFE